MNGAISTWFLTICFMLYSWGVLPPKIVFSEVVGSMKEHNKRAIKLAKEFADIVGQLPDLLEETSGKREIDIDSTRQDPRGK